LQRRGRGATAITPWPEEPRALSPEARSSSRQAFESGLPVSPLGLGLAAGFAVVIGLGAGVYPALRASRLHPVDAIRGA